MMRRETVRDLINRQFNRFGAESQRRNLKISDFWIHQTIYFYFSESTSGPQALAEVLQLQVQHDS